MSTVTAADIVAAYRFILGRSPEASVDPDATSKEFENVDVLRAATLASPEARAALYDFVVASLGTVWIRRATYFGRQIHLCLSDTAVSKTIILTNDWEPHVGRAVRSLLGRGDVFVDVGANVGWFSLLVGDHLVRVGGGRVVAIEANPSLVPRLAASVVDSGLDHIVEIKPYAVSDAVGLVQVSASDEGNIGGLNISPIVEGGQRRNIVPCLPLDDLLSDLPRCDLVKFDIEGAELLALKGFCRILQRMHPKIIMEINETALGWVSRAGIEDLVGYMRSFGYNTYMIEGEEKNEISIHEVRRLVALHGYWDFLFA